jgi:hypothetical protein
VPFRPSGTIWKEGKALGSEEGKALGIEVFYGYTAEETG